MRTHSTWLVLCAAAVAVVVSACQAPAAPPTPPATFSRLRVSGSGTCLPLLRLLASSAPDKQVRFIFLPGLHSKGGIKGVVQGSLDIGAVSRDLTPEEQSADLRVTWLSTDGLVMAVNPSVGELGIRDISDQQVRDIYAGKYTDWKQLGASSSLPIVVLDRHEDESAKIILRKYLLGPMETFTVTADSVNLYYESDMVDGLQTTEGAIGYFSLGYAVSQKTRVTLLSLNGVEASVANVTSGAYKLVRPLGVLTKTSTSDAVDDFLSWATGPEARKLMIEKGYAPYTQ